MWRWSRGLAATFVRSAATSAAAAASAFARRAAMVRHLSSTDGCESCAAAAIQPEARSPAPERSMKWLDRRRWPGAELGDGHLAADYYYGSVRLPGPVKQRPRGTENNNASTIASAELNSLSGCRDLVGRDLFACSRFWGRDRLSTSVVRGASPF